MGSDNEIKKEYEKRLEEIKKTFDAPEKRRSRSEQDKSTDE